MNHSILSDNQAKRLELPLWMLVCFSMFNAWQMGFIYFMGPSLVLDGRTPLPVDMDNVTMLIAAGYIISIIYMIILPHLVVFLNPFTLISCGRAMHAPTVWFMRLDFQSSQTILFS